MRGQLLNHSRRHPSPTGLVELKLIDLNLASRLRFAIPLFFPDCLVIQVLELRYVIDFVEILVFVFVIVKLAVKQV